MEKRSLSVKRPTDIHDVSVEENLRHEKDMKGRLAKRPTDIRGAIVGGTARWLEMLLQRAVLVALFLVWMRLVWMVLRHQHAEETDIDIDDQVVLAKFLRSLLKATGRVIFMSRTFLPLMMTAVSFRNLLAREVIAIVTLSLKRTEIPEDGIDDGVQINIRHAMRTENIIRATDGTDHVDGMQSLTSIRWKVD